MNADRRGLNAIANTEILTLRARMTNGKICGGRGELRV